MALLREEGFVDRDVVADLGDADGVDVAVLGVANLERKVGAVDGPIVVHVGFDEIVAVVAVKNVVDANDEAGFGVEVNLRGRRKISRPTVMDRETVRQDRASIANRRIE